MIPKEINFKLYRSLIKAMMINRVAETKKRIKFFSLFRKFYHEAMNDYWSSLVAFAAISSKTLLKSS